MARYALIGEGPSARPAPASYAPVIERTLRKAHAHQPTSILRTQKAVDFARAHGAELSSQRELYDGFRRGLPGFNPANRPGTSSHERRNDGVVAPWLPVGAPLPAWMVGLDLWDPDVARYCHAARSEGRVVVVTYPSSPSEYHHVNEKKRPIVRRIFRKARRGDRRLLVLRATRRLKALGYFPHEPRRHFDVLVQMAVKRFQSTHHLETTGVLDLHAWTQLQHSYRHHKKGHR